jgi:hypothetical protein
MGGHAGLVQQIRLTGCGVPENDLAILLGRRLPASEIVDRGGHGTPFRFTVAN